MGNKCSRSNVKAKKWLSEHGYSEIHIFGHSRWQSDLNFKNLKFDGIALSSTKLCLFQVKSNGKPTKAYLALMEAFAKDYGADILWFNCPDYKDIEVYGLF